MKCSNDSFEDGIIYDHIEGHALLFNGVEKQFLTFPTKAAIIYDGSEISYTELYYKMILLGHYINQLGIEKNTLIAILLPKSAYQIIAALGILKSGAAYMPINIHESQERKQSLLKQGEVKFVLTLSSIIAEYEWLDSYITISLDSFFLTNTTVLSKDEENKDALAVIQASPADLAYVLFTSGSTGTPKGVMISHASAMNTIQDINQRFNVTSNDKMLALSSLDFDLSVYDIFGLLSVGGTIIVPTEKEVIEPKLWLSLIDRYQITLWNTVPGFMEMLIQCIKLNHLNHNEISKLIPSIRLILLSGDWIRVQLPREIIKYCPYATIVSLGGATEAAIWSIAYLINVDEINDTWKSIPYGKPLKNQTFYILDENQNMISNNKDGELYIGGAGVSLGYWRDEINTAYHFIHHPTLGYLYRTGDKGKWLPDGNIEFLGRVGEQFKLRGFRIDLKSIESCIQSNQEVKRAVVKIVKHAESCDSLVAFVECENLREYLQNNFEIYQQLVNRHVSYWQEIYDSLFENIASTTNNPYFNTIGWVSSYSRKCIPEHQMREWRDATVSKIMKLKPKRILEVGVGTGLLLAEIAPRVFVYDVVDSSSQAIRYIEKHFNGHEKYRHIRCLPYNMTDLEQKYDTIILNSVAQYFPDAVYFTHILDALIDKTVSDGQVFLGDIYNYDYLEDFHLSVQIQQQPASTPLSQFNTLIKELVAKESQLYIHPQFIVEYAKQHPRISHVEIHLKSGYMHNEINVFRYDVVLSIEKVSLSSMPIDVINSDIFSTVDDIKNYLSDHKHKNIVIRSIPNLRLIGLSKYEPFKEQIQDGIASLRSAIFDHNFSASIDPHDCYQLGDELGYQVCCTWSSNKYCFDVAFYTEENPFNYPCIKESSINKPSLWHTNSPLQYQYYHFIESSIRESLSIHLAPYMQPHEIIFVSSIPFTANGKVNYKALLALAEMVSEEEDAHLQPNSLLEEQILKLFKDVLKVKQVNLIKSFTQLGGDSLRMLDLIHKIEAFWATHLTIGEFMMNSSVRELALFLTKRIRVKSESVVYTDK